MGKSTEIGHVNDNRQEVIVKTSIPGNDNLQCIYVLKCLHCQAKYGSNGSNNKQRKCPECQQGRPCSACEGKGCSICSK